MSYSLIPAGPFTRARLSKQSGLPDEVIAHWTKEGILRPAEQVEGTGRHKTFDSFEVQKAAILGQMRSLGSGSDGLRWMASIVDMARVLHEEMPIFRDAGYYKILHAISAYRSMIDGHTVRVFDRTEENNVVTARNVDDIVKSTLDFSEFGTEIEDLTINLVLKHFDDDRFYYASSIADDLLPKNILDHRENSIWVFWSTPRGWKLYTDSDANLSGLRAPPLSAIIIFASRTLRDLWSLSV